MRFVHKYYVCCLCLPFFLKERVRILKANGGNHNIFVKINIYFTQRLTTDRIFNTRSHFDGLPNLIVV